VAIEDYTTLGVLANTYALQAQVQCVHHDGQRHGEGALSRSLNGSLLTLFRLQRSGHLPPALPAANYLCQRTPCNRHHQRLRQHGHARCLDHRFSRERFPLIGDGTTLTITGVLPTVADFLFWQHRIGRHHRGGSGQQTE